MWRHLLWALACAGCIEARKYGVEDNNKGGDDVPDTRTVSAVIVGHERVAWSQKAQACTSDGDCPWIEPTVIVADIDSGEVLVRASSLWGADNLAGDENELFVVTADPKGETPASHYLARLRSSAGPELVRLATPLSPSLVERMVGPATDDVYVYWFELTQTNRMTVRRCLRSGDGTDASVIATDATYPATLVTHGGYLWWRSSEAGLPWLYRLSTAGGPIEAVVPNVVGALRAASDGVYVANTESKIIRVGVDGQVDVIVDQIEQVPSYIVVDRGEIFWMNEGNGHIYRAPLETGIPSVVSIDPGLFGVTEQHLLVELSRDGFARIPR